MTFDEWWDKNGYDYVTTRQLAQDAWEQGKNIGWNDGLHDAVDECQRLEDKGKDNHLNSWMGNAMIAILRLKP